MEFKEVRDLMFLVLLIVVFTVMVHIIAGCSTQGIPECELDASCDIEGPQSDPLNLIQIHSNADSEDSLEQPRSKKNKYHPKSNKKKKLLKQ